MLGFNGMCYIKYEWLKTWVCRWERSFKGKLQGNASMML